MTGVWRRGLVIGGMMLVLLPGLPWLGFAAAAERPAALTLGYDEGDSYPWRVGNDQGLNVILLDAVAARLGVRFTYTACPWKRCFYELRSGGLDGIIGASYHSERLEAGVYPRTADGRIDESRALYVSSNALFKLKTDPLGWDGKTYTHLHGRIAVNLGHGVADTIRHTGAEVDEITGTPRTVFEMVLAGRGQAAAMDPYVGDHLIKTNPEFAVLERLAVPVMEHPDFLMLSHHLVAADPAFAEDLWTAVRSVRESAAYQARRDAFLGQPSGATPGGPSPGPSGSRAK